MTPDFEPLEFDSVETAAIGVAQWLRFALSQDEGAQ